MTIIVVDAVGTITFCSDAVERLFGFTADELVGTNMLDHVDVDWNLIALESIGSAMAASGLRLPMLFRIRTKGGGLTIVEVTANAQMDDPIVGGLAVYIRPWNEQAGVDDILEALAADEALTTKLALFVRVMAGETLQAEGAVLYRPDGTGFSRVVASPSLDPALVDALTDAHGDEAEPWRRARTTGVEHLMRTAELPATVRARAQAAGLSTCWAFPVHGTDGEVDATLVLWRRDPRDIEESYLVWIRRLVRLTQLVLEQEEARAQLTHAATHDALTGLANRAAFFTRLEALLTRSHGRRTDAALARPGRDDTTNDTDIDTATDADTGRGNNDGAVGVLYLDLDGFKPINDRLGHSAGDAVLVALARRFLGRLRDGDLVARLGGDEFAVACGGLRGPTELEELATRLAEAAAEPIVVGDHTVTVGVSIGAALRAVGGSPPDSAATARAIDELVEAADGALYVAKAERSGRLDVIVVGQT